MTSIIVLKREAVFIAVSLYVDFYSLQAIFLPKGFILDCKGCHDTKTRALMWNLPFCSGESVMLAVVFYYYLLHINTALILQLAQTHVWSEAPVTQG